MSADTPSSPQRPRSSKPAIRAVRPPSSKRPAGPGSTRERRRQNFIQRAALSGQYRRCTVHPHRHRLPTTILSKISLMRQCHASATTPARQCGLLISLSRWAAMRSRLLKSHHINITQVRMTLNYECGNVICQNAGSSSANVVCDWSMTRRREAVARLTRSGS